MKILLVNPTGGPVENYGTASKAAPELPQIGLAFIAASLKNHGHGVRIVDCAIEHFDEHSLVQLTRSGQYDIVGFSVYITNIERSLRYAKAVKEATSAIVCVGGPQVTLVPDTFKKAFIDYIFIGEADFTMSQMIANLEAGGQHVGLPGVIQNKDGDFQGNRQLNLVNNLDELPLLELDSYYNLSRYYPSILVRGRKIVNVTGTRGCPFRCSFCAAAEVNGRHIRAMSVNRFVDQIQLYKEKGFDSVTIYDDTFTFNKKRAVEISKEFIKRNLNIVWNCFSRVDCVDYDTLSRMREAGCYLIMFGCESLNDNTLKKLRKGFTAKQCINGIDVAKNAGLIVSSSFMVGLPGENQGDILNTIKQVNDSNLDLAVYPIFEPYPGTPIYQDCEKEGYWVHNKYDNKVMVEQDITWVPNNITREELTRLSRYAHRSFYLRPKFFRSFWNIFGALSWKRKYRFINAGLDYFLITRMSRHKAFNKGARFP